MIQLEGLDDGYNVITSEKKKRSHYKFLYQVNHLNNSRKQYTRLTQE